MIVGGLSPREQAVLALIAEGLANKQIAEQLAISHNTVRTHVQNINKKLGVNSKLKAAAVWHTWTSPAKRQP